MTDSSGQDLWRNAKVLRERYWGRDVLLRGIVEFSSHCRQNCLYCGLRRDNTGLARYRMTPEAVFRCAASIRDLGFGTVVLQSGEDPAYSAETLAGLVSRIKGELGLAVALSLGERDEREYRRWRGAGADRYLLKIETADPALYARLRPGRSLPERLRALEALRALGYETGSGLIAGLPGEKKTGLERGVAFLASFAPDMFSISPFTPHPATPLGAQPACGTTQALRGMALARLACPTAHMPVASALGLHGDAVRLKALEVGNVLMPSLTPEDVRAAYAIYPGKNERQPAPEQRARAMRAMLAPAGFAISAGPGSAWRPRHAKGRVAGRSETPASEKSLTLFSGSP